MLDQFQVRDLPLFDVVLALETTPLRHVVAAFSADSCRGVLVLDTEGQPRGLVMRETLERHVARVGELRVGMLPVLGVVELEPHAMLHEAAFAVSKAGVGALVCRTSERSDPRAMLRDEMLNLTDWKPLLDARTERLAAAAATASAMARPTPPSVILL